MAWQQWREDLGARARAQHGRAREFGGSVAGHVGAGVGWAQGANARLGGSALGRAVQVGVAESFGFHYGGAFDPTKATNQGFLGLKATGREAQAYFTSQLSSYQRASQAYTHRRKGTRGWDPIKKQGRLRALYHTHKSRVGRRALQQAGGYRGIAGTAAKTMAGVAGKTALRGFGLLSTGYFAYTGYQEEGVWGAAKGVGESVAWSVGLRAAAALVGGVPVAAAAGVLAVGAGAYAFGEAAQAHRQNLTQLELGAGNIGAIMSPNALTMRQRSLMALNNTHLNARMALGNEAVLIHSSFR